MPVVSVIVPVAGVSELATCVEAIRQSLAHAGVASEIVVVVNGARDANPILDSLAEDSQIRVLKYPERLGAAAARKEGGAFARGDYLAFTDVDCVVPENWISGLLAACATTGLASTGLVPTDTSSLVADIESQAVWYGTRGIDSRGFRPLLAHGSMMVRKNIWIPPLGDRRNRADDVQVSLSYRLQGHMIADAPGLIVKTQVPSRLTGLLQRQFRHALGMGWLQAAYHPALWKGLGMPTPLEHLRRPAPSSDGERTNRRVARSAFVGWFSLWWAIAAAWYRLLSRASRMRRP